MTKFTIKTALLEALNRFAYAWDDGRPHLACVYVSKERMVATNGHRIIMLPNIPEVEGSRGDPRCEGDIDGPFLNPSQLILHHVAAVRSTWEEHVESPSYDGTMGLAPNSFLGAETEVTVIDGVVYLEHDHIATSREIISEASAFPPVDHLEATLTTKGTPKVAKFDPKLFEGVREVMRAAGEFTGLKLYAWDITDSEVGPTEYRTALGLRFILMGMADNAQEAIAARERLSKVHPKVKAT